MRMRQLMVASVCLIGLTQLGWSQDRASSEKGIPGYLDPRTGTFTARIPAKAAAAVYSGTSLLFREQFNITITNYDQNTADTVACSADIYEYDDANGEFYDSASVIATKSGSTYTCDVPVLTLWTLQTPTTDSISACVDVSFYEGFTIGPANAAEVVREQDPPCLTLSVPTNDQTVITTLSLSM